MQKKKIFAMLLSAMIVMSATAVSVSAEKCPDDTCVAEDVAEVPATCTSTGTTAGTKCSVCGEVLSGCTEIDKLEHTSEDVAEVPATCTSTGTAAGTKCSVCGEVLSGCTEIDKLAHTSEDVAEVPATCTSTGTAAGTKCSVCGEVLSGCTETPKADHSFTGAFEKVGDTQHKQKCANCEEYNEPVDCTNTDSDCVCGREKASQEEPGDIQIEEVVVYVGDFIVGEKLPAVNTDQDEFTVSYTWYEEADEPIELANDSIIEAKDYKCEVVITPKSGYTLEGLTKAIVSGFSNPEHDLKVETDGKGYFCIEIGKSDEPEDNPTTGGSSSSSSSSSSTTKPSVNADAEADKIKGAEAGQKVEVKIDGNTVPAAYVQAALSSKATIVVDYGTYAWEISDVKQVKAVDLSINTSARYLVEQGALKGLKGDNSNVIDIAHDGNLGFKGTLKYNVDKKNAGKFVNLYYYNSTTKKLELQGSTKIGADGNVFLPFTHCSTYVLNITATPASNELFEDFSAGESATVVEDTLPAATNAPTATEAPATTDAAANPETGNSAAALMAIPMAIAAAAIISKKR